MSCGQTGGTVLHDRALRPFRCRGAAAHRQALAFANGVAAKLRPSDRSNQQICECDRRHRFEYSAQARGGDRAGSHAGGGDRGTGRATDRREGSPGNGRAQDDERVAALQGPCSGAGRVKRRQRPQRRWVDFGKDQYARIRRRRQHGQSRLRTYSQSFRCSEDVRGILRRLRRGPGARPGAIGDGDGLWRQYSNARRILRRGWFQALTRRRTQGFRKPRSIPKSPVQWPARWRMLIFCCAPNSATRTPAAIGVFRPS